MSQQFGLDLPTLENNLIYLIQSHKLQGRIDPSYHYLHSYNVSQSPLFLCDQALKIASQYSMDSRLFLMKKSLIETGKITLKTHISEKDREIGVIDQSEYDR
jgi:hypothetical protein